MNASIRPHHAARAHRSAPRRRVAALVVTTTVLAGVACSNESVKGATASGARARAGSTTTAPTHAPAEACSGSHWVGVWSSSPTDASNGDQLTDLVDGFGSPKPVVDDTTLRLLLTPTFGGSSVRVRLSNRFGVNPVEFRTVTIAKGGTGAALTPSTARPLEFTGVPGVTVAPGADVVSDEVPFEFDAFENLAVSVYVPTTVGTPTEHFSARQTSYLAPSGSGDSTSDESGAAFTTSTSTRPFVIGLDARAPKTVGAVIGLGDSITDGAQNEANGFLESRHGVDANVRWTDQLARRLRTEDLPFSVLNAGISGNKLLHDGTYGGNYGTFGPSVLHRLDRDVIDQAGVTTVVVLTGINDISQEPRATPSEVAAGYGRLIERLHQRGLRVLQGTLTPFTGYPATRANEADEESRRIEVNEWIRHHSPADGIVDLDAAVRDPLDPTRLDPQYDVGDHLHFSDAGYQRLADAIPVDELAAPSCGDDR